jgi:hypothetical protein
MKAIRPKKSAMPSDRRTPIVAYHDRWSFAEGVHKANHVADEMEKGVLICIVRAIRLSVTAHVRCNYMISRFGQGFDLVPPRIPGLGKTVAQENQRASARFRNMDLDAVRFNKPVLD